MFEIDNILDQLKNEPDDGGGICSSEVGNGRDDVPTERSVMPLHAMIEIDNILNELQNESPEVFCDGPDVGGGRCSLDAKEPEADPVYDMLWFNLSDTDIGSGFCGHGLASIPWLTKATNLTGVVSEEALLHHVWELIREHDEFMFNTHENIGEFLSKNHDDVEKCHRKTRKFDGVSCPRVVSPVLTRAKEVVRDAVVEVLEKNQRMQASIQKLKLLSTDLQETKRLMHNGISEHGHPGVHDADQLLRHKHDMMKLWHETLKFVLGECRASEKALQLKIAGADLTSGKTVGPSVCIPEIHAPVSNESVDHGTLHFDHQHNKPGGQSEQSSTLAQLCEEARALRGRCNSSWSKSARSYSSGVFEG